MTTMAQVIQRIRNREADREDWLYITGDAAELALDPEADLGYPEFDEDTDEEIDPPGFAERGLRSTIDMVTLDDCIEAADQLAGTKDDAAALDVIRYYIRFDAWPNMLNAPDPPPPEVTLLRLDREFVENLGAEDNARSCNKEGCDRGVVSLSVFCRRHHFESVRKRPYPFED